MLWWLCNNTVNIHSLDIAFKSDVSISHGRGAFLPKILRPQGGCAGTRRAVHVSRAEGVRRITGTPGTQIDGSCGSCRRSSTLGCCSRMISSVLHGSHATPAWCDRRRRRMVAARVVVCDWIAFVSLLGDQPGRREPSVYRYVDREPCVHVCVGRSTHARSPGCFGRCNTTFRREPQKVPVRNVCRVQDQTPRDVKLTSRWSIWEGCKSFTRGGLFTACLCASRPGDDSVTNFAPLGIPYSCLQ